MFYGLFLFYVYTIASFTAILYSVACTFDMCSSLTLMLQLGGGYFTPRCTFYPVAPKWLKIVTMAFVTFPEYILAKKVKKNAEKNHISPLVFPIRRLENEHPTKKSSKILC